MQEQSLDLDRGERSEERNEPEERREWLTPEVTELSVSADTNFGPLFAFPDFAFLS